MLQIWRPFCNQFEGLVEDFNYGTLLRLDCEKDYTEENTIFGMPASHGGKYSCKTLQKCLTSFFLSFLLSATRAQFFAIEIARNREGYNDSLFMSKPSKS